METHTRPVGSGYRNGKTHTNRYGSTPARQRADSGHLFTRFLNGVMDVRLRAAAATVRIPDRRQPRGVRRGAQGSRRNAPCRSTSTSTAPRICSRFRDWQSSVTSSQGRRMGQTATSASIHGTVRANGRSYPQFGWRVAHASPHKINDKSHQQAPSPSFANVISAARRNVGLETAKVSREAKGSQVIRYLCLLTRAEPR
jgi:hypothetical protein